MCAEKIYAFYEFRLSYLESEKKLREMLQNFEVNQRLTASCSDSVSSLSNIEEDNAHFNFDKRPTDALAPNSLECGECGRCFERELELRIHSHTHRKNETPSQDSQNGFDEQFLLANIKSEPVEYDLDPMEWAEVSQSDVLDNLLGVQNDGDDDLRWKCTICHERFLRRAHLRAHRREHAVDGNRLEKTSAKKMTKDPDTKTIPQAKHDKGNINLFKKKPNFNLNVTADAQFERWQCKKCFSSFRTRRLLRDHNVVHRPNTSVASIDFDGSSILLNNSTFDETTSSQLFEQSNNVTADDKSPKNPPKKVNHSPKSHSTPMKSDSRWKCPKCRKVFETPKALRKHKLSHHTFEIKLNLKSKNFVSEKKNVSFDLSSSSSKKKHQLQQQRAGQFSERDWPCNSCHQVFTRRSVLRDHRRTVHMLKPTDLPITTMKQELDHFTAEEFAVAD